MDISIHIHLYFTFFNLILKYILRTCQVQNTMLTIGFLTVRGICNQNCFLYSLIKFNDIKGKQ